MAMTLADYAASTKEQLQAGVINAMLDDGAAAGGTLLRYMPIGDMASLTAIVTKVNNEGTSTGVGFRAIGEGFPEGTVSLYQESFNVASVGGDVLIDLAYEDDPSYIEGASPEVLQVEYKTLLINRTVNNLIINGDRATDSRFFNGARKYQDAGSVLLVTDVNATKANGLDIGSGFTTPDGKDFLSGVDRVLDYVGGGENVILVMNWHMKWGLYRACRDNGFFQTTKDAFDRKIDTYRGVPIVNPGAKTAVETLGGANGALNNNQMVLPNNFTFGITTTCSEIYAMRLGVDNGCALYQKRGGLKVRTVQKEMEAAPQKLIRIDWYPVFYPKKKSSIAVFRGVKAV